MNIAKGLQRIILLSLIVLPLSIFGQNSEILLVGKWKGSLINSGKTLSVGFDIGLESTKLKATMDMPENGRYSMAVAVSIEGSKVTITQFSRRGKVTCEGLLAGDRMEGKCTGLRKGTTFAVKRISKQPTFFNTEEVNIESGNEKLSGTLVKPNTKQYSVVVFIHGSGNQTRTAIGYRSLAYYFAGRGIAGLIFDRQGQGKSTGNKRRLLKMTTLADDVLAWVKYLKTRADIKKIGVQGLSQGGWVVPVVASRSEDVSFAIVDSAAAITIEEQNLFVLEHLLRDRNQVTGEKLTVVMRVLRQISEFNLLGKGDKSEIEAKVKKFQSEKWYHQFFFKTGEIPVYDSYLKETSVFDPIPFWEKVKIPVYGIWGTEDSLVPAEKSRSLIEKALVKAGNKNYIFRMVPDADHAIVVKRKRGAPWDWNKFAADSPKLMADWVLEKVLGNE